MFRFFKKIIYLFFKERGREEERERNIDVHGIRGLVAFHTPPTGDLAHNPGMCPDWESNQIPLDFHRPVLNPLSHTSQGNITNV